jgi:hypothetical protein
LFSFKDEEQEASVIAGKKVNLPRFSGHEMVV